MAKQGRNQCRSLFFPVGGKTSMHWMFCFVTRWTQSHGLHLSNHVLTQYWNCFFDLPFCTHFFGTVTPDASPWLELNHGQIYRCNAFVNASCCLEFVVCSWQVSPVHHPFAFDTQLKIERFFRATRWRCTPFSRNISSPWDSFTACITNPILMYTWCNVRDFATSADAFGGNFVVMRCVSNPLCEWRRSLHGCLQPVQLLPMLQQLLECTMKCPNKIYVLARCWNSGCEKCLCIVNDARGQSCVCVS